MTIESKKKRSSQPSRSFITINKWMFVDYAMQQGRSLFPNGGIWIKSVVLLDWDFQTIDQV
jgi:hypothetical protein